MSADYVTTQLTTMRQRQKRGVTHADEQAMHDQEVLRANKELAAYFKGRRTEREARAALKIIKAFVRTREQLDPRNRPPLPGLRPARAAKKPAARKAAAPRTRRRKPDEIAQPAESAPATLPE